ncbi:hypothetical protein YC2023_005696 [Brassica napus]
MGCPAGNEGRTALNPKPNKLRPVLTGQASGTGLLLTSLKTGQVESLFGSYRNPDPKKLLPFISIALIEAEARGRRIWGREALRIVSPETNLRAGIKTSILIPVSRLFENWSNLLNHQLIASEEHKDYLSASNLLSHSMEHVNKQGRKVGTVDELIQVITPKGRGKHR